MPRREWQSDRLASAKSRLSNQTPGVPFTHGQLKAALKNPGRACQFGLNNGRASHPNSHT